MSPFYSGNGKNWAAASAPLLLPICLSSGRQTVQPAKPDPEIQPAKPHPEISSEPDPMLILRRGDVPGGKLFYFSSLLTLSLSPSRWRGLGNGVCPCSDDNYLLLPAIEKVFL